MRPTSAENLPIPPFLKGGKGGFLARMHLIQNAAFEDVNLFRPFSIFPLR